MKYILTFLFTFLLAGTAYGATVPWNRTADGISPLYIGDNVGIGTTSPYTKLSIDGETASSYFTAYDSTATSTFENLINKHYFRVGYDVEELTGVPWSPEYFADFIADEDTYKVVTFGNFNAGPNASIDLTLNNASTSSHGIYYNMGMNSPNYNRPEYGAQNVPNLVYQYATGTPMSFASIGSTASTSFIQFITGSTLNTAEASRISNTGAWGIGSTSPSARLVVTNPLSTRTIVFEDQTLDPTPFQIDGTGYVTTGSSMTVTGSLSATSNFSGSDYNVNGGDIYQNDGDIRIMSEDSLYLVADRLNNDTDGNVGIYFGKNVTAGTNPTGNNLFGAFKESINFALGTSTTNATFTVVASSTSATTTVEFGDRYTSASKVCFNTKNTAGASISFYFVGTTLTIESNRCN